MTCKDCIHYSACSAGGGLFNEKDETKEMLCVNFKDKAKHIEFPCKIGDTVYWADKSIPLKPELLTGKVFALGIDENYVIWVSVRYTNGLRYYHTPKDFGKYLYLTRKEAKEALAEKKEALKHGDQIPATDSGEV